MSNGEVFMSSEKLEKKLKRFKLLEFVKNGCKPPEEYQKFGIYRLRQDFKKARIHRLNLLFHRHNVMEEWTEIKAEFILEQMENIIRISKEFNLPSDEANFLEAMEDYRRELFKVYNNVLLDDREINENSIFRK